MSIKTIKVNVKFFSIYSDVVNELSLILDKETTLREVTNLLLERFPKLRELFRIVKPIILVNGRFVNDNYVLMDGDEVAFLPPFSGG